MYRIDWMNSKLIFVIEWKKLREGDISAIYFYCLCFIAIASIAKSSA